MTRRDIGYSTIRTNDGDRRDRRGNPIMVTLYQFYPDGVWDEDKLTRAEAEAKYPQSGWRWKRLKD